MTRLLLLATLVAAASARRELRQSDVEYGYDAFKQRYVDTLWVFTASAPKTAGADALGALRRAAESFEVVVD